MADNGATNNPHNLPSGTVTFLFTDIEGSTKLWERYPEAMKTALARHDSLLRQAVKSSSGQVIKSTGDGIYAVFEAASDGAAAGLRAQQALDAEAWDELKPSRVKVRMGLHTGEAERREGDYFGGTLNRAARLMSAAHGGQILVSNAAAELLHDQLPLDANLRDLGEHRLKDLVRPEHVFQLMHPAIAGEFPPIMSVDSFPNNLPVQLTSFVGRERELGNAKQKLATARLLTLIGPGGTGKTRLALQLAADLVGTYPDGVWFIKLAPLTEPDLIPETIAAVFGVRQQMGIPLVDTLLDYLRAKETLLILDNCEHLVEACAKLTDGWLHASPNMRIVATSREALSIRGETIYGVPSLSVPAAAEVTAESLTHFEAVQLFLDRAVAASPRFALTDKNAAYVAQICRRLDGIPLALELAAARVNVLAPEQIASRLDDRFKLLTSGGRTTVPRQQTLRAAIDWSYEILGEAERALLRRLSVFAGGWTLEAAEAISPDLDVLDLLTQLVNKSLVIMEAEETGTRYRMLETIRQYGRDKVMEAGEWEDLRRRHLAYFLEFGELGWTKMFNSEVYEWLPRLRADYDNFRSALEWGFEHDPESALRLAGALSGMWLRAGQTAEGVNWIKDALQRADQLPKAEGEASQKRMRIELKAWHGMAILAYLNDNATAREASEAAILRARALGDQRMLVINLAIASWERMFFGDNAGAQSALDEALSLGRSSGDGYATGIALAARVWYHLTVEHDPDQARLDEAESLRLLEDEEFSWGAFQSYFFPARGAMLRGEYEAARQRFAKALPQFERLGDLHRVNMIRSWLAHMQRYEGHYREAAAAYCETILLWQKLGQRGAIAHQLESFGFVSEALEQPERAARLFGAAEALREKIEMPMGPEERVEYDNEVAALRDRMDEKALTSAWAEGRKMTMEQAIAYAIAG